MSSGLGIPSQALYSAALSLRSFCTGLWLALAGWEAQKLSGLGF